MPMAGTQRSRKIGDALAMVAVNLLYTGWTGVYLFGATNLPAAAFLDRERVDPAEFGVRPGRLVLGYVGALAPEKGVDLAISALADLPDAELLVIGDGPARARYVMAYGGEGDFAALDLQRADGTLDQDSDPREALHHQRPHAQHHLLELRLVAPRRRAQIHQLHQPVPPGAIQRPAHLQPPLLELRRRREGGRAPVDAHQAQRRVDQHREVLVPEDLVRGHIGSLARGSARLFRL